VAAGYIFTRAADLYGRCIALLGRRDPLQADGSPFFVDVDVLRTTADHHLISQGLAYPTYYRALFPDLRNEFTATANQARDSGLGVWASDRTTTGADVTGLDALDETFWRYCQCGDRAISHIWTDETLDQRIVEPRPIGSCAACDCKEFVEDIKRRRKKRD
jgi:hypothetical protein